MKKNPENKSFVITTLLCLVPMALGLALYARLPEQLPTHWDWQGNVNGYMSKPAVVLGLPLFFVAMNGLMHFSLRADPKRANIIGNIRVLIRWTMPVLSLIILPYTYLWALGWQQIPMEKLIPVLVGLLIMGLGNYLPKCRQNYTSGIKLPWTLYDEDNWNRTHRMAGRLWMVGGLGIMVSAFWGGSTLLLAVILAITLIPGIYSYCLYRKKQKGDKS
ncbi:SdpI family protein [Fournierella massiliensis]|nr:SdpI family protein [Fournierella massiliensis]MCF2557544.1 SdpI family protein [Fournierella massiliensis]